MTERDPLTSLEFRVEKLASNVDLNDMRVRSEIEGMRTDIAEIKVREKDYVRADNFAFYEKAFWIVASATGSIIVGNIFYFISTAGGK
jgi:hypothetical protein